MYTLTTPISQYALQTLIEVFQLFRTEPALQPLATSEFHLVRDGEPVTVMRFNGALTVRHTMPAGDLAALLVDEVTQVWFRSDDTVAAPWQIRRKHWESFQALFGLDRDVRLLFSSAQIEAETNAARVHGEHFRFSDLVRRASTDRLGFGFEGPREPVTGYVNGRHEVHVAYALALNLPVPEAVIADYQSMEQPFRHDLEWAAPLLDLPVLRGALSPGMWRSLAQVLRHAKVCLTTESADAYIAAVRALPEGADPVAVDNRLFAAGLLQALPLPERYMSAVDVGAPVSELAVRLRELAAGHRRADDLNRADDELAKGLISKRLFDLKRQMVLLDHGRSTFEWPNRVATAVIERNVRYLLSVLDTPDTRNNFSKQAVRDVLGVKLRGLRPQARRRAVFALCGFDDASQAAWEVADASRREADRRADDARRAREAAEGVKYRRDDGSVVTGAAHVDESIAAGFVEIRDWRKGAARIYALVNPLSSEGRALRVKDGTLAYARTVLDARLAA